MVLGENGIIKKAGEAKVNTVVAGYEERLNFIVADEKIDAITKGEKLTKAMIQKAIEEEMKSGREEWIVDVDGESEENMIIVTSEDGHVFYVIVEDGKVEIKYAGPSDSMEPMITKVKVESTQTSLIVGCKVLRLGNGKITYSYSTTEGGPYTEYKETIEESCEITGLDLYTKYYIKIEVTNDNGHDEKITEGTIGQLVTGIDLSKTSVTIKERETETITATISPSDASNKNVTWSSSNTSVATVNNGTITGVTEGTVTITCTANDGSNVSSTCTVTVESSSIPIAEAVSIGDYINYTPTSQSYSMTTTQTGYTSSQSYTTSSYTGGWQVLYNDETNGVQIISTGSVGSLYLQGENGYNNLVGTLNTMAGKYVNTTYAKSGRSVGSLPTDTQTSTGTTSLYTDSYTYFTTYGWNNKYKIADTNYTSDQTAMTIAGVKTCASDYWVASRYISRNSSYTQFYGRYIGSNGAINSDYLWRVYSDGSTYTTSYNYGVRPIITLKSGILINTSDTTKDGTTQAKAWELY